MRPSLWIRPRRASCEFPQAFSAVVASLTTQGGIARFWRKLYSVTGQLLSKLYSASASLATAAEVTVRKMVVTGQLLSKVSNRKYSPFGWRNTHTKKTFLDLRRPSRVIIVPNARMNCRPMNGQRAKSQAPVTHMPKNKLQEIRWVASLICW